MMEKNGSFLMSAQGGRTPCCSWHLVVENIYQKIALVLIPSLVCQRTVCGFLMLMTVVMALLILEQHHLDFINTLRRFISITMKAPLMSGEEIDRYRMLKS